jgi:hypothetical protein
MQAVIGSRQIDTVRFEFDANPTLISPATLLSQRTPASVIVSELLVHRPVP